MALPKKGSRVITIEGSNYQWMVSGNDGWMDLYIEPWDNKGQLLKAKFDYHHEEIQQADGVKLKQQFVVTPDIVKQTIEIGIEEGWKPKEIGKPFDLHHLDDKIDWKK